ncbi:MAG TPA: GYF domain-containing protein [Pirellulales bacterium]|jgi:hypothetical protein|nr:GYF domain-containing protein [Pirellulales bacterium]
MGVKFTCPHCNSALNVKSEMAGKRGRCPRCNEKISIPAESEPAEGAVATALEQAVVPAGAKWTTGPVPVKAPVSARVSAPGKSSAPAKAKAGGPAPGTPAPAAANSPAQTAQPLKQPDPNSHAVAPSAAAATRPTPGPAPDPISEAPQLQWYVMPPGASSQYGPAAGDAFRSWIQEGRVTAESLVWRQDWPEWKRAGNVFPELDRSGGVGPRMPAEPGLAIPTAAGAFPTAADVLPAQEAASVAGAPGPAGFAPFDAAAFASPAPPSDAGPAAGFDFSDLSAAPRAMPVLAGGFPAAKAAVPSISTTSGRSTTRRGARSNNTPIMVIVVLGILLIPLSYLVWMVINEPPTAPAPAPAAAPESSEAGSEDSDE